jgi:hypothetical protein
LRGVLREHFGNLDKPHEIGSLGHAMFESVCVEDMHAGGAGIELDVAATVFHGRFAGTVEETEFARNGFQGTASKRFRNVRGSVFHASAGGGEKFNGGFGLNGNTALENQRERLREDTIEELRFEK